MREPTRLLEKGGLAGALLRVGAEEQPSVEVVHHAVVAVATAAGVASISGGASGAGLGAAAGSATSILAKTGAAPFTLLFAAKWLGVGVIGGLLSVTAASRIDRVSTKPGRANGAASSIVAQAPRPPVPQPASSSPAPPLAPGVNPNQPETRGPVQQGAPGVAFGKIEIDARQAFAPADAHREQGPGVSEANTASASPPSSMGSPRPSASDDGSSPLAQEIAYVDRGWRAMQRGDCTRALLLLGGYEREFPDLRLHPEVLFVRMEAESQLGHAANAIAAARHIASVYPKSAQAARARALLGQR